MAGSEDSSGQGVPSEAALRCCLPPPFFRWMKLMKALAPTQWRFLVRSRVLGPSQPTLTFQQVTGALTQMGFPSPEGKLAGSLGFRLRVLLPSPR